MTLPPPAPDREPEVGTSHANRDSTPPDDGETRPSTGEVRCDNCGGWWTWSEAPKETWPSPHEHTWTSRAAALRYRYEHACGRRFMTVTVLS